MSKSAVWRTGETLTLTHLAEHATALEQADSLTERLERAATVTRRQRHELTRLYAVIRQLQEVPT